MKRRKGTHLGGDSEDYMIANRLHNLVAEWKSNKFNK